MRSPQYEDGRRNGVKACVAWLHELASTMNDPKARAILNSAGWNMGASFKEPPSPEPQDEAIGGLIERLGQLLYGVTSIERPGGDCSGFRLNDVGPGSYQFIEQTADQAASALSRLQVERDELEALLDRIAVDAEPANSRAAGYDDMLVRPELIAESRALLARKTQRGDTSSQSQPCSETGPNTPSSPQTPFSDGGGEP